MNNLAIAYLPLNCPRRVIAGDFHPLSFCAPEIASFQALTTPRGVVFNADCLDVLPKIQDQSVDTIFADPPFNLDKQYGAKVNDNLSENSYLIWSKSWLNECVRILKPGGSLFVYNLPKWNILLGAYLTEVGLSFRHWIAVNIKLSLPIPGRLYPSHYSLLYYTKGRFRV
ncbi:MAG: DNA methyltransferase [Kiritimatiellia bacterium]|jgi:site-specific DNA-methyltransferase (adenine-specific)|nr:DNA methyltransferase [Kiritimatiellia bacterium]